MKRYSRENSQAKLEGIETGSQVLKINRVNVCSCQKRVVVEMLRNSVLPCIVEFSMQQVVPDVVLDPNDQEGRAEGELVQGEHEDGEFETQL